MAFAAVCVVGCSTPGPVKMSPDTYMISRTDHAGIFGSVSAMKAEVISDASKFAESQGKVAIPLNIDTTPVYPGHLGTVEYQFRVVDKNDPEAKRTYLKPRADRVEEKTENISLDVHTKDDKAPDLYTELSKLDDLRKRGIITEEEFNAQKKKLLEKQ